VIWVGQCYEGVDLSPHLNKLGLLWEVPQSLLGFIMPVILIEFTSPRASITEKLTYKKLNQLGGPLTTDDIPRQSIGGNRNIKGNKCE